MCRYIHFYCPEYTQVSGMALNFTGEVPAWVHGTYVVSSLGKQSVFGMETTYYMDGFMKAAVLEFGASGVTMSTKITNTNKYESSEKLGHIAPGITFQRTSPPRKSDDAFMANM